MYNQSAVRPMTNSHDACSTVTCVNCGAGPANPLTDRLQEARLYREPKWISLLRPPERAVEYARNASGREIPFSRDSGRRYDRSCTNFAQASGRLLSE